MQQDNEIIFEDLHGVQDEQSVTVDLDADSKDDGIERTPAEQAADDDAGNDDDIKVGDIVSDDESDDDDAALADASRDSEDDEYSKKVKARIERERRAKRKEAKRADSAEAERDYWRDQAQQIAKDNASRSKDQLKKTIEQADSAIESAEAELESAIENGNTSAQVKLTSKLTDLKAEKIQAEISLNDLPETGEIPPFDGKVPAQRPDKSLADKWVDDRGDWYGQRGFERETRLANRIDREVFADGFDPKTPEYFEELDKRLKKKIPKAYEDIDALDADADDDNAGDEGDTKRGKRRRSPVAPVDGADTRDRRQRQRSSKVELTEEDFANMRRFNLDPNNPEVLKEYARNKAETLSGGQS